MEFRLSYTPPPFLEKIEHTHKLFLIGSCFTENIGDKLKAAKFHVHQNPNGILFNPVSVCNSLLSYIENREIKCGELFNLNEGWHSWDFHSRFSAPGTEEALEKMNASVREAHQQLKEADVLVITLGSAWVYILTPVAPGYNPNKVAANNHKAPAKWFDRILLSSSEVEGLLRKTFEELTKFNPNLKTIFTVSPVRHIREGFVENNRSKASLIQAVHSVLNEQCHYFPAYELVIDDLRDYRFFAEDMVHPNYFATNYVWEKFMGAAFSDNTRMLIKQIDEIRVARQHKPFNSESHAHAAFLENYFNKTKNLAAINPFLDFTDELSYFSGS